MGALPLRVRTANGSPLARLLLCFLPLLVLTPASHAAREPVLKQIQLPHSYYWREMYLPQLTSGPSSAAFTPDGKAIVYSKAGSLWWQLIGSDEARELTHGPGYDYQPDVSPDGRSVVFVRHDQDALELWRLDLATGVQQALTRAGVSHLEPRWSPDGKRLAFVSTRSDEHGNNGGRFNLFVADIDERGLRQIRPLVANRQSNIDRYYYSAFDHAVNPSWNPDGERIFYVGNPEVAWGSGDLWSVSVGDPADRQRVLVEETTWAAKPELAADGKRLLYSSYQGRQWHQLWLTTPTGQSPLPLTFGEFDRRNARWSPDGRQLLYISNESGNLSLWLQDVIGGKRQQIAARHEVRLQPQAELLLNVVDDAGKPLPARVTALAANGRHYAPVDAWLHADDGFDRQQQRHEHHYFHCQTRCSLTAPVGKLALMLQHGFGKRIVERTITLKPGQNAVTVQLPSHDLPAVFGQHLSADLHVHMNYGGHYRQQLSGLAAQAAAEDLDIVYNLIVNKEQRIPDIAEFATGAVQLGDTTIYQGQEFHTSYWGHLGLLHLDSHFLTSDFSSYRHTALASPFPHNGVIADLAHAQNALVGYVHPFDWQIVPEKEKKLSHAFPVDVALGKTDYYEVVSFADHLATADVWHRLLNLGFRVAAGAGTDAMTNYASLRGPVGLNRVFLRSTSREPVALKRAIKSGHGFVSNGPLLGLKVGEALPGETVVAAVGETVTVQLALRSPTPVSQLELLWNGKVIRRISLREKGLSADATFELPLTQSGWLLLRAWNDKPSTTVQDLYAYASTNPVWIETPQPAPAATEDAQYFLRWLDRVIADASARDDYNNDDERRATLDYLQQARAVFVDKAQHNPH